MIRDIGRRVALLGSLLALVGCDHVTKLAAKSDLQGAKPSELIRGVLDLRYVENTDVAFNLLRWLPSDVRTPALLLSGAIAVVALLALLLRQRQGHPWLSLALLLVTAGALGNYLDRVARGYVVDFVHLHHWPVFNVADSYICIGVAVLAWLQLGQGRRHAGTQARAP
jgi:signal peptidase II